MNRTTLAGILVCSLFLPGCGRDDSNGPPAIRLGRNECAFCGMLLSEERCACAMVVEIDGQRTSLVFDDLGCLLDYRTEHPGQSISGVFVHDYAGGGWVNAGSASYLAGASRGLKTPMGSGMIAFTTRERAEKQRAVSGGELVDFEHLARVRLAGDRATGETR